MSSSNKNSRRGSYVGNISLGDTAVPALSTMPPDPKQERESRRRVRALSVSSVNKHSNPVDASITSSDETDSYSSSPTEDQQPSGSSSSIELLNRNSALKNDTSLSSSAALEPTVSSDHTHRHHKRHRKHQQQPLSSFQRLRYEYREFSYRNTWFNPFLLLLAIILPYQLSSNKAPSNILHMFNRLSYEFPKDPISGTNTLATVAPFYDYPVYPPSFTMYGKGLKDLALVFTAMVFFMFFREFCMQVLLKPLARFCGLKKSSKIDRFMEQTYSILYFSLSTPFGLYIMYHNPEHMWYYNTESFYIHYPHKAHDTLFKLFYLLQAGFWAQQSLVLMLQLEKPRRDFKELVFHHVITMALIYLSYHFHFAMIGIAVFITMDCSDIFLSLSKTFNYLDSPLTVPTFFLFICVWVYTRHYLNIKILWSILTEFKTVGPYIYDIPIGQFKCWISQSITFTLLLGLQLVNMYWLFLILRIMVRYVLAGEQKDERSDDEDDDEESPEKVEEKQK